jgi:dihydrofolate reductase
MRKIINSTYISLDGVIENPQNWPGSDVEDGAYAVQRDLLADCDTLIMGRRTYDSFSTSWPTRSGDEYSDRINSMTKYVVSSTLGEAGWTNTSVIADDVPEAMRRLKDAPGQNIVQYGFGRLSYTLMEHGLLDELRLWVHPYVVGSGGPGDLLYRDCPAQRLRLVDTKPLASGIVILSYEFLR